MTETEQCPVPLYQNPAELDELRRIVRGLQPERVLEIGSLYGGSLWCWMQDAPGAEFVSVDRGLPSDDPRFTEVELARGQWGSWLTDGQDLFPIRGESTDPGTGELYELYAPYDFIFIDGGHTYDVVSADFENCWPLLKPGGVLALHDIAYPIENDLGYGTGRLWQEIRDSFPRTHAYISQPGVMGIGVVWK